MKILFALIALISMLGTASLPALAQNWHDHHDAAWHRAHDRDWHRDVRYVPRRPAWRRWHGRRVIYYGGHWGYWAPHNGVNLFIRVPL